MADNTISDEQKALVVALELLRVQVQDNALALVANTQRVGALMSWYAYHVEQFVNGGGGGGGPGPSGPSGPTPPPTPPHDPMPTATPVATPVVPTATPVATVIETAEQRQRRQEREQQRRQDRERTESRRQMLSTAKTAASPATSAFAMLGAKFAAVAGPLAILAQALSATTSGFGTLSKASSLLASVLAPVLLPATLMAATAMVAISSVLTDVGMPALQSFFEFVVDAYLPAIELMVDGLTYLFEATKIAADTLKDLKDAALFVIGAVNGRGSPGSRARTGDAMRDVLESFRRSIGPKAQISGLAEVGKQAQLAALNADPLEARLLRQQLMVLERIAGAVERRRALDATPRVYDPVRFGVAVRDDIINDVRNVLARLGVI